MFCITCGTQLPEDAKFCGSCGRALESDSGLLPNELPEIGRAGVILYSFRPSALLNDVKAAMKRRHINFREKFPAEDPSAFWGLLVWSAAFPEIQPSGAILYVAAVDYVPVINADALTFSQMLDQPANSKFLANRMFDLWRRLEGIDDKRLASTVDEFFDVDSTKEGQNDKEDFTAMLSEAVRVQLLEMREGTQLLKELGYIP